MLKNHLKKVLSRGVPTRAFLTMCALSASLFLFAQQAGKRGVSGTVSDESGEPVVGANVVEKGVSANGTITDADGRFSLNVSSGATLVVSYIGYTTKETPVGNKTSIDIVLDENSQLLDEVVVVGYGTQKKVDLAGNVAVLNVNDIRNVPVGNLSQALAGRLPGVTFRSGSGGKPGSGADVVIGARGTWNSNAPLYVIDGAVRDAEAFNMLSASDIEQFSVLKDASAAAVYGARASNGVFLVTTKKGKSGKPVITYSGSYSTGDPAYEPERETFEQRYRSVQAGQMEWRNVLPVGQQITADGYQPYRTSWYKNGKDASEGYINTAVFSDEAYAWYSAHQYDRLKEVYQTPVTNNHSLNVNGGNDYVKYYIGGNFYDESGIFKVVGYKKHSVRANVETKITDNLTASLGVSYANDQNQSARNQSTSSDTYYDDDRMTITYGALRRSSLLLPNMVDDKYLVGDIDNTNGQNTNYAAIANGDAGHSKKEKWLSDYTVGLKWELPWVKGLTAQAMFNRYSRHQSVRISPLQFESYVPMKGNNPESSYAKNGGLDPNGNIVLPELSGVHATRGDLAVEQSQEYRNTYQLNGQLSYANTFGKHAVEGTLVYEQTETYGEWVGGNKGDLKINSRSYLDFGGDDRNKWGLWGGGSEEGRISYAGRIGYTFDNRYQASFSFRNDLSAKFGPDRLQKSGFFPAGNVYWRISEESFMKDVAWLNNLKLRASIGLTGNDNTSAYQYLNEASLGKTGMLWGGNTSGIPGAGIEFGTIANPAITWEKTLSKNIGLDMGLFNMLTVSADLWKNHTYDIIAEMSGDLPDTFGAKLAKINYGILDSYGFELEIGFNKQLTKDVTVWAKGNFGYSTNKLIEFAEVNVPENQSRIGLNTDRIIKGKSDGIVWDMRVKTDAQGNPVTKDYGDGKGPQTMYVVTTSTGNTYVVPRNYMLNSSGEWIDNNGYNNLRPGVVFKPNLAGTDKDSEQEGHFDSNDPKNAIWGIERLNPPFNYGLLLGGNWKGFSVEALIQGMAGHQNYMKVNNMANAYWYGASYGFWSGDAYSQTLNPTGKMPMLVNGPSDATFGTDFWVRDASFVRLKNVTLGYELPKSFLSSVKIAQAKVFVSAQNLCFLYNALKFFDPELTSHVLRDQKDIYTSPDGGPSYDSGVQNYPLSRTVTFGLTLSF